jgi:BirA family biotin operon repressor/biotin-[acetyl-CoA-carboxylase] ligase
MGANILIEVFEELPSTNDYLLGKDLLQPTVCLAKTQTAGKGRLGRAWHSPLGSNLYFSLYWRFQRPVQELSGLSIAVGLACLEALGSLHPLPEGVHIKWPNDLEYQGAKFAGILTEIHRNQGVVIGVGMNLELPLSEIEHRSITDLARVWNQTVSADTVLTVLLNRLIARLPQFDSAGLASFMDTWEKYKKMSQCINEKGELLSP